MCIFVIKVKCDNVDLMTFSEEGMIMKSTASSIYMECCHIKKWWENKQNIDNILWIYTAKINYFLKEITSYKLSKRRQESKDITRISYIFRHAAQ